MSQEELGNSTMEMMNKTNSDNEQQEEYIEKINQRIREAVELAETESEDEEKPYQNKYNAREKLEELAKELIGNEKLKCLFGKVLQIIGKIYYETDEVSSAENYLIKAINNLGDHTQGNSSDIKKYESTTEPVSSLVSFNEYLISDTTTPIEINYIHVMAESYNYLGVIWSKRSDLVKAKEYLQKAEEIYSFFKKHESEVDEEVANDMEGAFTLTAFYLAQVSSDPKSAARYCFLTLQRQLESGLDFNKIDWAENCLQLSAYFLDVLDYKTALHFIKAAEYILMQNESGSTIEQEIAAKVVMAKGKLCLDKLIYSKSWIELNESSRISNGILEPSEDGNKVLIQKKHEFDTFYFNNIPIEHNESDSYVCRNFSDALEVFREGKKCLEKSMEYYVIDGFVTDHIKIQQDLSSLYKMLIFFEENLDRKIAIHERRLDLLEKNIDELNVTHYRSLLKQIAFEVGETYASIFELLLLKNNLKDKYKEVSMKKINTIISKTITIFGKFSGLFEESSTKVNIEDENKPAYFRCHLIIARMYYNYISSDPKKTIDYMAKSLKEYEFCVKFFNANKNILEESSTECELAQQMVSLLPVKINEINALLHK